MISTPIYGNIKLMFQTTNQFPISIPSILHVFAARVAPNTLSWVSGKKSPLLLKTKRLSDSSCSKKQLLGFHGQRFLDSMVKIMTCYVIWWHLFSLLRSRNEDFLGWSPNTALFRSRFGNRKMAQRPSIWARCQQIWIARTYHWKAPAQHLGAPSHGRMTSVLLQFVF